MSASKIAIWCGCAIFSYMKGPVDEVLTVRLLLRLTIRFLVISSIMGTSANYVYAGASVTMYIAAWM